MPVMCGLVHNLRDLARLTDAEARQNGKKSDALDNCGTLMQSCFRTAIQATGEAIARMGTCKVDFTDSSRLSVDREPSLL